MKKLFLIALIISVTCLSDLAIANDAEDAVPLFFRAYGDVQNIKSISIKLESRTVKIDTLIENDNNVVKRIGFVAYTPFFEESNLGEEHADKSFSDLKVKSNDRQIKPSTYRRGFFLGTDITNFLSKAGIDSLPSSDINSYKLSRLPSQQGMKIEHWQGFVSYSWISKLPPQTKNHSKIQYQALPEYGIENVNDENFSRRVIQHCGAPEEIKKFLNKNGKTEYVIFERYQIPINFNFYAMSIEVLQPEKNWLGAKPVLSLVCGISDKTGDDLNFRGSATVNNEVAILVISKILESAAAEKH